MGDVAHLRVDGKPRDHVTLTVEALASALAMAEDLAYRRGLRDSGVDFREANRLTRNHEATYDTRVDLYVAIWKRGGKGL